MRIGAGVSTSVSAAGATAEAARDAARALEGHEADLAFLFLSRQHLESAEEAASVVREELAPRSLVGCVAQGVLARSRELEEGPGAAVWAGSFPGAEIDVFHAADPLELPEVGADSLGLLLVDPFTFAVSDALADLNERAVAPPVVGGIAVAAGGPGAQALIVDEGVYGGGAVGAVLTGVPVVAVVSQGCAPFGREAVVTRGEGNLVFELAGQRALDRLREEIVALPPEQQRLAAQGILAGLVIDENRADYGRGDYLMRGILGGGREHGGAGDRRAGSGRPDAPLPLQGLGERRRRPAPGVDARAAAAARRPALCSSPATGEAHRCSPSRTTTRARSPISSVRPPSPASSAAARSGPSAAGSSCTASRRRWPCSSSRSVQVFTYAERPDLSERVDEIDDPWPEFIHHDQVCIELWSGMRAGFPELQLVLYDEEADSVVGRGQTAPAAWDGTLAGLPGGVDDVLTQRFGDGVRPEPTCLSAIVAVVDPGRQGEGLSRLLIEGMRRAAAAAGFADLIAPVRPSLKSRYPLAPLERYIGWRRDDGLLLDPWLRVHERLGAEILAVCPRSMTIKGSVGEWEAWTGLTFVETGPYVVDGALVPVEIDREADLGSYVEPNVWMRHSA